MASSTITIDSDVGPLLLLLELAKRSPQLFSGDLDLANFPGELARVEQSSDPADATKILIRLYPSDSFLDLLAACAARDGDGNFVE